jgi:acyl-CoA reductase-like NAD-dependent aldehyde dehydrogenase
MTDSNSPRQLDARNPRSGEIDYQFYTPSAQDIADTAARLKSNQTEWLSSGVDYRISVLRKWQAALEVERENIVAALAIDTGRLKLASIEFYALLGSVDRWCNLAPDLVAQTCVQAKAMPEVEIFSDTSPYPLLAAISPWNFPLLLSFIDVTPALLAGCSAIIKPSEVTPRFAEPLIKSILAVPELAKVLSIKTGDGITGQQLIAESDVVAFTGSVATGKKVAMAAADSFIPAFLELGGKDPAVILQGSNLERATTSILRGSVSATGQACQSLERIYVNTQDAAEFTQLLTVKAKQIELTKDDPKRGSVGPLIFARQGEIIAEHLRDAVSKGAVVECGGEVIDDNGALWVAPTVLSNVDHSMKIMTEETFGPIMPIMMFDDATEAVRLANETKYGLSAAVFGPDDQAALVIARQINAGGISVNDSGMTSMVFETEKNAFGYSGMGPSRVGPAGLTRFLRRKSLYVNRGPVSAQSEFNEHDL